MTSESGQPNTAATVHIQTTLTKAEFVALMVLCYYAMLDTNQSGNTEMYAQFTAISRRVFGQFVPAPGCLPALIDFNIVLTQNECDQFLFLTGWGTGAAHRIAGLKGLWQSAHVVNQIFAAVPQFEKYEIPQEYRWQELQ
jgi:hypothetical protein